MEKWWQEYCEKKSKDTRPLEELIAAAVSVEDEHAFWDTAGTIQTRTDRATFERAIQLCRSGATPERQLGASS